MKYTISRDGQIHGTYTFEEVRVLQQTGELLPTDVARADPGEATTSVAQLLAPSAPPTLPPVEAFLVRRGHEQFGPFPLVDLQRHALGGRFLATDVAWCAGMPAWEPVFQVLQRRGIALPKPPQAGSDESLKWVLPVGRSALAIAAGYLGLFSVILLPAPFALVVGILALRDLKKNPSKGGRGRAWFGVIAGGLFTIALLALLVAAGLQRPSTP